MDYLTKWPEVFAVHDQAAATIARLLVEEIASRHGVPAEILLVRIDEGGCKTAGNSPSEHYSIPPSDRWISEAI